MTDSKEKVTEPTEDNVPEMLDQDDVPDFPDEEPVRQNEDGVQDDVASE